MNGCYYCSSIVAYVYIFYQMNACKYNRCYYDYMLLHVTYFDSDVECAGGCKKTPIISAFFLKLVL